jgi:endogenous inhibitor of DNA gyrase (YacG/DUF329 family)
VSPSNTPRTVACPSCGKTVRWEPASRYRPFCSERCKTLDLGDWAAERFQIPDDSPPDSGSADGNRE